MRDTTLGGENRLEKPCLVETGQGFSISYKNRLLYSKYSPKRAIVQTIEKTELLPNTLILCASPVLWYGLKELLEKIPENCMILGIETDENLYELAKTELEKWKSDFSIFCNSTNDESKSFSATKIELLPPNEIKNIVEIISGKHKISFDFPQTCDFRRAIMIEMSGGTSFDKDFYKEIYNASENAIAAFWKNRITLTKLGRLFSKNLLKNLSEIATSTPIEKYLGKIEKPIIVFGAGEGTGKLLDKFSSVFFEKFFVLSVDAAVPPLKAMGIKINGIVAVESQLAIEKAYIGGGAKDSIIFADISSRNQILKHTKKSVSFFATEFAQTRFFDNLKSSDFFPPVLPPLGSVGLTATYLALLLRKNVDIPVFFTGLDFSFSLGATHTKGAPANIQRLSTSNKLNTSENYDAAFKIGAQKAIGKDGKIIYTDIALSGYAKNFNSVFHAQKSLFDIGECGLNLGLPKIDKTTFENFAGKIKMKDEQESFKTSNKDSSCAKKILDYLENEEKSLERIKELLIYGQEVEKCGTPLETELTNLISPREYLFLHFPDGFKFDVTNLSLLKRIRTEIDFYLKTIKRSITLLSL